MGIPITVLGNQMKGLLPALDRRHVGEPHIVEGKNFIIDAKGPKSYWGNLILSFDQLPDAEKLGVQSFRLGENTYDTVLVTSKAIYKYDTNNDRLYPIYVFLTSPTSTGRWSMAFVGGQYFFAKDGYDLYRYNPTDNTWDIITLNVPTGLVSCAESDGRLILLGANEVRRSAIDDGSDLVDAPSKGVGARALTLVGGDPIYVAKTFEGHMVWTTEGIIRAEAINEQVPFRYTAIASKEIAPISAWAITEVEENKYVWLSKTGMYQSDGRTIEPYQPLMSEYLTTRILNEFDLAIPNILLLHYSKDNRLLFVSIAESQNPFNYTRAFVLYLPRDQWGSFDRLHYGWVELGLTEGVNVGHNFGYVCGGGYIHKLITHPYQEVAPRRNSQLNDFDYIKGVFQTPSYVTNGTHYVASDLHIEARNPAVFTEQGYWKLGPGIEYLSDEPEGATYPITVELGADYLAGPTPDVVTDLLTEPDSTIDYMDGVDGNVTGTDILFQAAQYDLTIEQMPTEYMTVDSSITIGPFRVAEGDKISQAWWMNRLAIGTLPEPEADVLFDYLEIGDGEDIFTDYMDGSPDTFTDFGSDLLASVNYDVVAFQTADGFNVFENNSAVPYEYNTSLEPEQHTQFSTVEVLGVWGYVQINALNQSQNFHLKLLEVEGTVDGRLE